MSKPFKDLETRVIHSGEQDARYEGAVAVPVFQSSTYLSRENETYDDVRYIRLNNTPNHRLLNTKLADLDSAEAAMVTASGMAAITTLLLTELREGDHILAQSGLYGGTHHFVTCDLQQYGISHDLIGPERSAEWDSKLKPTTRAIYVESMTNPLIRVADLRGVVEFAREHGLLTIIDNTFATPVHFRPLEMGFNFAVQSATKYLNGHNDIVAGVVAGSRERISKFTSRLNHFGGSIDPHACFLLNRGLKTLVLRVERQSENAGQVARFLADHPAVDVVNYPGLESHADHSRARELFSGFGAMLSFELKGGLTATDTFLKHLTIPLLAPSLGGVETLITLPSRTSHVGMPARERRELGISDHLIRLSVGIESSRELIADFERALDAIQPAVTA